MKIINKFYGVDKRE